MILRSARGPREGRQAAVAEGAEDGLVVDGWVRRRGEGKEGRREWGKKELGVRRGGVWRRRKIEEGYLD